jgi:hypothetical protein
MKTITKKKSNWLYENRLKLVLLLFLVVLPLLLIPAIYASQYIQSKPILFEDKKAEAIELSDLKIFTIEYEITQIKETSSELKNGYYTITYTINKETTVNTFQNIKVAFQLSTRWQEYNSANSVSAVSLGQEKSSSISFNLDMNKSVLPLIKPQGPYLYMMLTYEEMIFDTPTPKTVYVKLPMDFSNTVIIPA